MGTNLFQDYPLFINIYVYVGYEHIQSSHFFKQKKVDSICNNIDLVLVW